MVPGREIAVVCLCVHDIATVIRRAWPCDALACQPGIDKGICFFSDLSGFSIEMDTAKAVLAKSKEELVERTDLEEETIDDVLRILAAEFEE